MDYDKLETFNYIKHWDKLNQRECCLTFETEKLYHDCIKHLEELGYRWVSGQKPTESIINLFWEKRCLYFKNKRITLGSPYHATSRGIQILNYKEW